MVGSLRNVLFVGLVLAAVTQAAANDASLYNRANDLYRKGRHAEAKEGYEGLVNAGLRNADVYYNLGNAYYKTGRLGKAILNYERALELAPGDGDIRANLRFADAMKRDQMEAEDLNAVARALKAAFDLVSADGLAVFCSLCLFALAAAGIVWLFVPGRRPLWLVLLAVVTLAGLTSGSLLALKVHGQGGVRRAVVLVDQTDARSGPGEEYLQVFSIHEGTRVTVERVETGWVLVRLQNGVGGWLTAGDLEEI